MEGDNSLKEKDYDDEGISPPFNTNRFNDEGIVKPMRDKPEIKQDNDEDAQSASAFSVYEKDTNEFKGGELLDRINKKHRYKEVEAAPIIKMLFEALFYLHEHHRVVHSNLKPDNILFVNESEASPIKIIDFGMSKVLPRLGSLRGLCGTPYYSAPEIIKGDYAHGCDCWSVGVIMFVMLFGFPPFYADRQIAIYRLIQKGFDAKVKRGCGPWFPKEMAISDDAKDLMAKLMESDTSKRLTAKEALQHPYILNMGKTKKEIKKKKLDVDDVMHISSVNGLMKEEEEEEEKEGSKIKPRVNKLSDEFEVSKDSKNKKIAVVNKSEAKSVPYAVDNEDTTTTDETIPHWNNNEFLRFEMVSESDTDSDNESAWNEIEGR